MLHGWLQPHDSCGTSVVQVLLWSKKELPENPTSNVGLEKRTFLGEVKSCASFSGCSKGGTQIHKSWSIHWAWYLQRAGNIFFCICWALCYLSEQPAVRCLPEKNLHHPKTSFFFRARRAFWIEYSSSPSRDLFHSNLIFCRHVWRTRYLPGVLLLGSVLDIGLWQYAGPAYTLPHFNLRNPNFSNPFMSSLLWMVYEPGF